MLQESLFERPIQGQPLVVSHGMGVDSTAMCLILHSEGIRPTAVLHADTGSEWPETDAYRAVVQQWLEDVGWPPLTIVKNPSPRSGHTSLEHNCVDNRTMPSIAYGFQRHGCSLKWKVDPMDAWIKAQAWAQDAWFAGQTVIRCIGYDASAADKRRTFKAHNRMGISPLWSDVYPLQDRGIDRDQSVAIIEAWHQPVPRKSSCFFCPAMKQHEIIELAELHPELAARALRIEALASHNFTSVSGLGGRFSWRSLLEKARPALLARIDQAFDTGRGLPEAYASGTETWIPKRKRAKAARGQTALFAA